MIFICRAFSKFIESLSDIKQEKYDAEDKKRGVDHKVIRLANIFNAFLNCSMRYSCRSGMSKVRPNKLTLAKTKSSKLMHRFNFVQ